MNKDVPGYPGEEPHQDAADLVLPRGARRGPWLALSTDLTIVEASDTYRRATLLWREEIRGCGMFEVFPDNPEDSTADGVQNLRGSLLHVLRYGEPHRMPIQRYDVRDHVVGHGVWVEKFWATVNTPVFGGGSREVTHVVHQVTDVTQAVALRKDLARQDAVLEEQAFTLQRMREDLVHRRREMRAAQKTLANMLRARSLQETRLEAFRSYFGLIDPCAYLAPGDRAPETGIYTVYHQHACERPQLMSMQAGRTFPRCSSCRNDVLYRLLPTVRPRLE